MTNSNDKELLIKKIETYKKCCMDSAQWINQGCTPYHFAAVNNEPEVIEELLTNINYKYEIDVNQKDVYWGTPLLYAAINNANIECFRLLLKETRSPWMSDSRTNKTPLYYEIEKSNYEIVKLLIENGVYWHLGNNPSSPASEFAKKIHQQQQSRDSWEIVKILQKEEKRRKNLEKSKSKKLNILSILLRKKT